MKPIINLLGVLLTLNLNAQEIKLGFQQSFNNTDFLTQEPTLGDDRLDIIVQYPSLGFNVNLNQTIFLEQDLSAFNQVNNSMVYEGYRYQYGLWSSTTTISQMADSNFYAGVGVPLSFVHTATQSNEIGTIDLIDRGNAPELLYGFLIKIGFRHPITSRMILYADLSRIEFLNSLDTDPNQELKAINYVFSLKAAFSL